MTIPLLVGEAIYEIRSALDGLVYQLAVAGRHASGKKYRDPTGTQFPIEDNAKMFEGRVTGKLGSKHCAQYLAWVQPEFVQEIRAVQPFAGCQWTRLLRDISNQDKHRFLSEFSTKLEIEFRPPAEGQEKVNMDLSIEVFLRPDLIPLIPALQMIHEGACAFVGRFEIEDVGPISHGTSPEKG